MPCRSEYMAQNEREAESQLVCQLLQFVFEQQGEDVPKDIAENAKQYYADTKKLDEYTATLCSTLSEMSKKELDNIVYNGRNKVSRMLADWWDRHQDFDKKRKNEEDKGEPVLVACFMKKNGEVVPIGTNKAVSVPKEAIFETNNAAKKKIKKIDEKMGS